MRYLYFLSVIPLFFSCSVSKNYNPNKKYSPVQLKQDYLFLRDVLEKKHPSLYWYAPKDQMDFFFNEGYKAISDSMTELQFGWQVLSPVIAAIRCGHTSFTMSKGWNKFIKNKNIPSFPLYMKVWNDTMLVVANLNEDSIINRGNFITAINGIKNRDIIRRLFNYMPADGYAENVNYIRLSGSFPYFHRNVFGLYKKYHVSYTDSNGIEKNAFIPYYGPPSDTSKREKKGRKKKITHQRRLKNIRSLQYDSSFALMTINGFSRGHLNSFFKRSFRDLRRKKTGNLVIDLRFNGGGDIDNSVLLTKFLRNSSFKVADSAYSIAKNFRPYTRHISSGFFNNIGLLFLTHKNKDGKYHFRFWERHTFRPKRRNHFNGNVYVLINGLTFSASTLFCNAVKGQPNITLAGEETGGGWYGNSGIMIPDITLPHTRLRVRLPFFRLVQYQHTAIKGTGITPDIYIGPNWRDILNGVDTKIEVVKLIIKEQK